MDEIEVGKAFDYLKGLINEKEFISMTEDIIKATEGLAIKPKTTKETEDECRVESALSLDNNRRSRNVRMFDILDWIKKQITEFITRETSSEFNPIILENFQDDLSDVRGII